MDHFLLLKFKCFVRKHFVYTTARSFRRQSVIISLLDHDLSQNYPSLLFMDLSDSLAIFVI